MVLFVGTLVAVAMMLFLLGVVTGLNKLERWRDDKYLHPAYRKYQ